MSSSHKPGGWCFGERQGRDEARPWMGVWRAAGVSGWEPRKSPGIVALSAGGPRASRAEEGAGGEREGNPYMFSESNLLFSKLRKC